MTTKQRKADGTLSLLVHLTLKPGRDDQIIDLIRKTSDRNVASRICEVLRIGLFHLNRSKPTASKKLD